MRVRGGFVARARLITGLVLSTLTTPGLADELGELRQQLAEQHKVMQALGTPHAGAGSQRAGTDRARS